ncbi:Hyaluronan/mRNA-binding protein [Neofusicoccum parvum]|uniref:Hyaluronan/mRNA-binding protein domain-containing protein n=3 Tax=Neofusicoccum TaxID=407951 RepID=A0ABR3T942_9PEZI|nr:putative telomere and ribosome associated protein [Neofusicoccum parvum UCRNP2]GME27982.1 Hyaluronan/mRNA-binding protein [Neofusicoccum parvum]GME54230.1 Hyaluronan/mRNA-binding protein [Neofusicoccum parvum]
MASGSIASKNLYELLGNDPELDPERRQPVPPTKAIDKPAARTGKRNAGSEAPLKPAPATGVRGGRQQFSGNEGAFRDRTAGSSNNRGKPTDDGLRQDRHSNRLRGGERGGRGGRGGPRRDDRHGRTGVSDTPKQVQQGWGGEDGNKELADEIAGDAIAKQEEDAAADEAAQAEAEAAAEEEKVKSYDDYLAEILEKKAALGGNVEIRKPNEGASKKFPEGKAIERAEEEAYFAGDGGKKARDRGKKEKAQLDLGDIYGRGDERGGFRGGRGGPRGGRGGPREGGFRGEGRGRGGRGGRGGERGGAPRGGAGTRVNINDSSAFPSLGA